MRRDEFVENRQELIEEILDQVQTGHLALTDEHGWPVVKTMHFARLSGRVVFHGALAGERAERVGAQACFAADRLLANLPSYWRSPDLPCQASAFYVSVMAKGTLFAIEEPEEKARALQALMEKYQPEGGYERLTAGARAALASVLVLGLDLAGAEGKLKVGQNLTPTVRRHLYGKLLERGLPGDREAACWMRRTDPSLADERPLLPRRAGELALTDRPQDVPVEQLRELMDTTFWAAGRTAAVIRRLLQDSLITAALEGERLVGFARAISDGACRAWIYDVIVRPECRGKQVGRRVMEALLAHPGLARVERVSLTTRDAEPFYVPLGFRTVARLETPHGVSAMMRLDRPAGEAAT
jgi:nitroimidazol reductase NimA-like FMN-containing flavoprotein (pyridoxamine 5'-phosphate oxidase superfamily)/ribosomal protein S18 acetylase RimI-like enzyme